jgi:hypothetical protein
MTYVRRHIAFDALESVHDLYNARQIRLTVLSRLYIACEVIWKADGTRALGLNLPPIHDTFLLSNTNNMRYWQTVKTALYYRVEYLRKFRLKASSFPTLR